MVSSGYNIHEDLKNILKEGYLMKESKFLKSWRKRWFVLTPNTIYTFKEQKQYKDPTEIIELKCIQTIKSTDDETNQENSFKIEVSDTRYNICASSNHEKEQWIGQIGIDLIKFKQLLLGKAMVKIAQSNSPAEDYD